MQLRLVFNFQIVLLKILLRNTEVEEAEKNQGNPKRLSKPQHFEELKLERFRMQR